MKLTTIFVYFYLQEVGVLLLICLLVCSSLCLPSMFKYTLVTQHVATASLFFLFLSGKQKVDIWW